MRATVFDSHAVLALLFEEAGAARVQECLQEAALTGDPILITAMNWAEVLYRVAREQGIAAVAEAKRFAATMPLAVIPVDRELAERAAEYKAAHKMSLADAFAAALTKQKKATLVTGDPEFKPLEGEIKITWLR